MPEDILSSQPALAASLIGVPAALAALLFAGRLRRSVALAGVIGALLLVPLAWLDQNARLSPQPGAFSPVLANVIASVWLGCLVWFAASLPFRARLRLEIGAGRVVLRLVAVAVRGLAFGLVLWLMGASAVTTLLLALFGVGAVLGWRAPAHWRLSVAALSGFVPVYMALSIVAAVLVPEVSGIWSGSDALGQRLWLLPLKDLAIVVVFAAVYPLILGWVYAARFERPGIPPG
jgi:hypothetical protein